MVWSDDISECVLSLRDGEFIKVGWADVYISRFVISWAQNDTKTLLPGLYSVGTDIPAGRYLFGKIEGDNSYLDLHVFEAEYLSKREDYRRITDTACVLSLQEGQLLLVAKNYAVVSQYNLEWTDGEITLPFGMYYIGKDLPAGTYHFRQMQEDSTVPGLSVYNSDNLKRLIDSAGVSNEGWMVGKL